MRAFVVFFLLLGIIATNCFAEEEDGFVFGIKPGSMINSAYVGFKFGMIVPMAGLDVLWLSASGSYTYEDIYEDNYSGEYVEKSVRTENIEGHALLMMPHVGAKVYFGGETIKPYLYGNLFFSVPSVSAEEKSKDEHWRYVDGVLVDHYVDSDENSLSADDEELIEGVLSFWGFTFAGGAEYFLNKHFSVGGEYGFRILLNSVEQSSETSDDYGTSSYTEEVNSEVSATISVTYAVVTLNYHF